MNDIERINKIKAMGFNPHTIWYHGSAHNFDGFSYSAIGQGEDAHGPGFYFTNIPSTADSYAFNDPNKRINNTPNNEPTPMIYPVHLKLNKGMNEGTKFTKLQIKKIIQSAPNLNDTLMNFGDVDYHGIHKVLDDASEIYKYHTGHQLLNVLRNDFFKHSPETFMKAVTKHTGYDHMNCNSPYLDQNQNESWVVAFHPHQIRSIHAEYNPDNKDSGNLLEEKLVNKKANKDVKDKKSFKETLIATVRKKRGDRGRTEVKVNGKSTIIINPDYKDITKEYNRS